MPYNIFVADRMENTQLIPRSVDYVFDKYGVHPRHILQFRSVIGDPSDNIKAAVPRMDRKVLRKFVVDWQENGFEKAVERIEKDKIREKLQEGKSAILDNLKVMSLVKYRNEKHRFEIQSLDGGSKEDGIRNVRHYGLSVYENFLQRMNCVE